MNHQVHLIMGTMKHHTGVDTDTVVTAFKQLRSAQLFLEHIKKKQTAPVRYWILTKAMLE